MNNDFVSVPRMSVYNLCSVIRIMRDTKRRELDETLNAEEINPVLKNIARSITIRNEVNDLDLILDMALNCAPDDIKVFFKNYDNLCAECPF